MKCFSVFDVKGNIFTLCGEAPPASKWFNIVASFGGGVLFQNRRRPLLLR